MSLTAESPGHVNVDAHRAGAHHAHAQRVIDAVHAIDPTVHARIGDLGWTVYVSRQPLERFDLGEVTVRIPTPWDVRDGVCYARATEWQVYRSSSWTPAVYPKDVRAAARASLRELR